MDHHPNILNNLLANLRKRYFPGQFKTYVEAVGIGTTYLRKLESGEISQPNNENLGRLLKAYGYEWELVLQLLTKQIRDKAYSVDPNWNAIETLFGVVKQMSTKLPCETIIQHDDSTLRRCDNAFYSHPDSTFILEAQSLSNFSYEDQIRLVQADNVSLYDPNSFNASLPLLPYTICVDNVLSIGEHPPLCRVTANSEHIQTWRNIFIALRKKCMTLEQRMQLMRSLATCEEIPHTSDNEQSLGDESEVLKSSSTLTQRKQQKTTIESKLAPHRPTPIPFAPGTFPTDLGPYKRPVQDNEDWDP